MILGARNLPDNASDAKRDGANAENVGIWERLNNPEFNPIEFDGIRKKRRTEQLHPDCQAMGGKNPSPRFGVQSGITAAQWIAPTGFTITNPIAGGLTAIERARGFLEAATLSEQWIARMSARALLLEAHHTTHIEGTELTLDEAARLWAGETVAGAKRDDVRELLNCRDAFNLVSDYLGSGEPIAEGLIREIHKRLVTGVRGGAARPGSYRTIQNCVANSRTREVI